MSNPTGFNGTEPTHTLAAVREAVAAFDYQEFTGAYLIHYLNFDGLLYVLPHKNGYRTR